MNAIELKETRQKLGLSLKDSARLFRTPERTWRAWEAETGPNARRVPGCIEAGLAFYEALPLGTQQAALLLAPALWLKIP